jgi:hypothetical protein
VCSCQRHVNINAVCTCFCSHGRVPRDPDHPVLVPQETRKEVMPPRLRVRIYKHTHECSQKGEIYRYFPPTRGGLMFPVVPVCIEADVELELITSDGENWKDNE